MRVRHCFSMLLFCMLVNAISAQKTITYSKVVVIGDSLSDDGDFYATALKLGVPYPGPTVDFTLGRFTDGADTTPAALAYTGVWVEQLNSMLPGIPVPLSSLGTSGGTDHAFGASSTGDGLFLIPFSNSTLAVRELGQQVTDYLSTSKPDGDTLFIVFGGANDFFRNASVDPAAVAARETALVQRLAAAGAVNFLVPNLPPLPSFGSNGGIPAFDTLLAADLAALQKQLSAAGTTIKIVELDLYGAFGTLAANPTASGFTDITTHANSLPATANPDTYATWDGTHPTTAGHHLIAAAACTAMTMTRTTLTTSASPATSTAPAAFTAVVSSAGTFGIPSSTSTPTGNVAFYTGLGTPSQSLLGTAALNAQGVATFSSASLAQGSYTVTAVYAGDPVFPQGCRGAAVPFTVSSATAGLRLVLGSAQLSDVAGSTLSTTVGATPVGGFTGNVALSCGTLPQYVSCTFTNGIFGVTSSSTAAATLTLTTSVTAVGVFRSKPNHDAPLLALLVLPLGLLAGGSRRQWLRSGIAVFASTVVFLTLTGCGDLGKANGPVTHTAVPGTYMIAVTGTSTSGATSTANLTLTLK